MKPRALLAGCALSAALIVPTTASAATKVVSMGVPTAAQKKFQNAGGDANAYFPSTISVQVGGKVKFLPNGFHTLDLPAKGGGATALLIPTGSKVTGEKDAAGQPFWFNGNDAFGFNPALLASGFGKKVSYTGAKGFNSGLPLADKPQPIIVTFKKAGTYTYFCDVHPGMKGRVHVVGKKAKVPTVKSDAKTAANQVARDLTILKSVNKTAPGSGVVQIGGAGKNGVESYRFFPAAPSVKVGTTVTFKMPAGSTEVHTATTGPGNPETEPDSYLGTLANSFNGPAAAGAALYPSEQPGGTPASLSPALHGNGFWNSGLLDVNQNTPLAPSNKVTFAAAGTYTFYCLIHPFMKATVTVTP